jgi:hypothetical protein
MNAFLTVADNQQNAASKARDRGRERRLAKLVVPDESHGPLSDGRRVRGWPVRAQGVLVEERGRSAYGASVTPDYTDSWGARVRGTVMENEFWYPA